MPSKHQIPMQDGDEQDAFKARSLLACFDNHARASQQKRKYWKRDRRLTKSELRDKLLEVREIMWDAWDEGGQGDVPYYDDFTAGWTAAIYYMGENE